MTLLPRTLATIASPTSTPQPDSPSNPPQALLLTLSTGAIGLLTPLSEAQYRRLSTLANHLSNTLYHAAGMNPKAYRIAANAPEAIIGGRPIVDGNVLWRWMELGAQRRAEVAGRVGVDQETVRDDLEEIGGALGYL